MKRRQWYFNYGVWWERWQNTGGVTLFIQKHTFLFYWHAIGTSAWKWWIGSANEGNVLKSPTCFFFLEQKTKLFFINHTYPKIAQFPAIHPHQRVYFPFLKPHGFVLQFFMTQPHCNGAFLIGGFNVYSARLKHECLYISVWTQFGKLFCLMSNL